MARSVGKIVKYRDFLKERVDTDKILDCLMAKTILSKEEVDEVKSRRTMCRKNEKLLDIIIEKEKEEEFIVALGDANQRHLTNYLLNDGARNQNVWEDWPLLPTKIQIIDVNYGSLKDLIESGGGLVDNLIAKRVISLRHKQLICSKATDSEKNEAFLDILRRGSMLDYENTIQCLRDSNQYHVAEILEKGGAVIQAHAELQEPLDEDAACERITYILRGRTVEGLRRILDRATHKLIAAKKGHSVIFYFHCKTSEHWRELRKAIRSGSLKITIEELCKRKDSETNVLIKAIHILDRDQKEIDKCFAIKGSRGTRIASRLGIYLALYIAIVLGFAYHYVTQSMPCWSKYEECQGAQAKLVALLSVHDDFALNFKQLQNATSELLQTVKESPDNNDLLSFIWWINETLTEETRQKFRKRIRQLEKGLWPTNEPKERNSGDVLSLMWMAFEVLNGETRQKIAKRIRQLEREHASHKGKFSDLDDLLGLIDRWMMHETPNDEPRQKMTKLIRQLQEMVESYMGKNSAMRETTITHNIQNMFDWIRKMPVTKIIDNLHQLAGEFLELTIDMRCLYEKILTEKRATLEKSMQETVLVLAEYVKRTEGVNHLLRRILTNFNERSEEICSETSFIKESKKRSYQELHTGMLRLTCLLAETLRMAPLVSELNTQMPSLKQDIDRMVEDVNEYVKQTIPSLLAALLTGTELEMPKKLMKPR